MKLSVSNIAWSAVYDEEMYKFLSDNNFKGLEIAPTRIFPDSPYDNLARAKIFAHNLKEEYGLGICSVQSVWFGVSELIFGSGAERQKLADYTKKAVNFAREINCANLVFGCPRNRAVPPGMILESCLPVAYDFFNLIGNYAADCGTSIAIEPNPPIYNTNFINSTAEALDFCKKLNNPGIKINADLGAVIYNKENINILKDNIDLINHVHISEPYLAPLEKRELHAELKDLNYDKYLSVEMADINDIEAVKNIILYIKEIYDI